MNIRDWPMGQIMQLPDCCFGRRFSVCASVSSVGKMIMFDISELALPEKCVLWEVVVASTVAGLTTTIDYVRVALGDQLPTTVVMVDALEPLVPGLGLHMPEPRHISGFGSCMVFHLRNPIAAMGRRLVIQGVGLVTAAVVINVICEFSSIPREVPDCLISEYLRSQS